MICFVLAMILKPIFLQVSLTVKANHGIGGPLGDTKLSKTLHSKCCWHVCVMEGVFMHAETYLKSSIAVPKLKKFARHWLDVKEFCLLVQNANANANAMKTRWIQMSKKDPVQNGPSK